MRKRERRESTAMVGGLRSSSSAIMEAEAMRRGRTAVMCSEGRDRWGFLPFDEIEGVD